MQTNDKFEAEEIIPVAGNLAESMRDFGYTLPTAIADLVDNSITAAAMHIDIIIEADGDNSHIAIIDDGHGMSLDRLIEAMRMGSQQPERHRDLCDLGRFGLGMKTASLSQGRCLTVITKPKESFEPIARQWNIDYVRRRGWKLLDTKSSKGDLYYAKIAEMPSGTAVVIEDLDRPGFINVPIGKLEGHLGQTLEQVRKHLGMVFHRFIEKGTVIKLGHSHVRPWDPFMQHKSVKLATETLNLAGNEICITPYILPHHSKLTDEEHHDASGTRGWNDHQGFYIYRSERLIIPGSWLNLRLKNEEHMKLARIKVDGASDFLVGFFIARN